MSEKKLSYSFEEAAAATSYSITTLKREARLNRLPVRYANSKGVILATDLTEWLNSLPEEAPNK